MSDRWHDALLAEFAFMKAAERVPDAWLRSLPLAGDAGHLLPVCELHAADEALITTLAAWRAAHQEAFPTRFHVTVAGTAAWLRSQVLDRPDRMLFLVVDPLGHPVGHLGLVVHPGPTGGVEVDNVVRGREGGPGLMSRATERLLRWAREEAYPPAAWLRVLHSNTRAIAFYERLGFVPGAVEPLRLDGDGEQMSLVPVGDGDDAPPDDCFLTMDYRLAADPGAGRILTAGPATGAREAVYVADAAVHGWNACWSRYLDRFTAEFAAYVGAPHALATSSGTGALHLAFACLGIGPGDEVIVPDITWVATAAAVAYTGATPVFADVEPDTWCLDPQAFQGAITERTRAVVPVHLYGQPARIERIVAIARTHGLAVVEDAAPAIGATRNGTRVGTFGDVAAFSFQGAKLLVTGEGGMLVTTRRDLYERARFLWDQGRVAGTFDIEALGMKYKMANVQAALGLAQLERIEPMIAAKRRIHGWYAEELDGLPGIDVQREIERSRSIYWMTNIRVSAASGLTRDGLRAYLDAHGIDTRPVFPSVGAYGFWGRPHVTPPVAAAIAAEGINLPSGVRLERSQVARVGSAVRAAVAGAARVAA